MEHSRLKQIRIFFVAFWCCLAMVFSFQLKAFSENSSIAVEGLLDLSAKNVSSTEPVKLDGTWEFYWNQLIPPEHFSEGTVEAKPLFAPVPGPWNQLKSNGKELGGTGFATYRLQIRMRSGTELLALDISDINSSFRLYVNGELVSQFGIPATEAYHLDEAKNPSLISDPFTGETLDIVLHVSNYGHSRGGVFRSLVLGQYHALQSDHVKAIALELFIVGSILIIGIYHFGIFLFRQTDKASLFFGMLCLLFAIREGFMGERFFNLLFDRLNLSLALKIEYLTVFLALPVFLCYIYHLFPNGISKRVVFLVQVPIGALTVLVLLFPESVYYRALIPFELLSVFVMGYICISLLQLIRQKTDGVVIVLAGFLILFLAVINDILYANNLIETGFYLPLGLLGFILFQALHLSRRFSLYINHNEALSRELKVINETLENRVQKRTEELRRGNELLKKEIENHKTTAEELKNARQIAEDANLAKSEFLANMSHELRTPMHGILGFARFGEDKVHKAKRETLLDYFREIRSCGQRLLMLLNDLLDLSKLESGKIIYEFESHRMDNIVETVIGEFSAMAKDASVQVKFETANFDTTVVVDEGKMMQVVRNLLSNAIKYSTSGSEVTIRLHDSPDSLTFSVEDRGVGIPEAELNQVFDKFVQSSKTKTAAGGTGLGLPICQKIIYDHKGEIWAKNNAEGGVTFLFRIPKEQKTKKKLGEILVEQKLISQEDLNKGLNSQKQD